MASRGVAALGGAAQGASAGAMIGGPVGAGIGGLVGGLGGLLFGGGGTPEFPDIELTPELLEAINFDDLTLEGVNPELYNEILKNQEIINRAESVLSMRADSNAVNRRKMDADMQQATERMSGMGLAGTPTGEAMMADFAAKLREEAERRAFTEMLAGTQAMNQMRTGQYDMVRNALTTDMAQRNANRNFMLEIDKMKNAQALGKYQGELENDIAKNQFWSGMFNAGMTGLGNYQNNRMNADFMNKVYGTNVSPSIWSL